MIDVTTNRTRMFPRRALRIIACGAMLAMPAYGYIDPTSTGLLAQLVTPILMIAATGLTFFRRQVSGAFRWVRNRFQPPQSGSDDE